MPLTQGNVTIKLAGGTYSTWAAFWDDLGNLDGNITCTVDASAFTEATAPAAITESLGGFTLHVLPVSFPTTTDVSTGARFTYNYVGNIFDPRLVGPGTLIVEGMVFIEGTSLPAYGMLLIGIGTEYNLIYRRNTIKGCNYGISHQDGTLNSGTNIYNNIIYDTTTRGINVSEDIPLAIIANNTVVASANGFYMGDEELTLENNLSYGSGTADFINIEILTIGNNNADSDSTAEDADWGGGGANNVNSIADPFNNLAADDFTITAEGVVGTAGLDLSGNFTDDFFGITRVSWTIGACEWIAQAKPPLFDTTYRRRRI